MGARRYIFVHEIILTEEEKLREKLEKLPLDGRRTKPQTIKQVRQLISDAAFKIARKYNVLVSYPHMTIQGKAVVLGKASILLPSGRYASWDELKEMELERETQHREKQPGQKKRRAGY
ncbi:MAG: hypothetical protein Q4C77_04180 [Eubacteriales bacterium]|nr:hypothetical protein [Eubacteriales bacterium]